MRGRFITSLLLLAIFVSGCIFFPMDEVSFCRSVFSGLVKGKFSIEKNIDWAQFTAMGSDIGSQYKKIGDPKQKANYRKGFIYNFRFAFEGAGGELSYFQNWRIYKREPQRVTVAVDMSTPKFNKTLLLYASTQKNKMFLTGMNWLDKK